MIPNEVTCPACETVSKKSVKEDKDKTLVLNQHFYAIGLWEQQYMFTILCKNCGNVFMVVDDTIIARER